MMNYEHENDNLNWSPLQNMVPAEEHVCEERQDIDILFHTYGISKPDQDAMITDIIDVLVMEKIQAHVARVRHEIEKLDQWFALPSPTEGA